MTANQNSSEFESFVSHELTLLLDFEDFDLDNIYRKIKLGFGQSQNFCMSVMIGFSKYIYTYVYIYKQILTCI